MASSLPPRPATPRPKTIVVCCDGTWQNSNDGWHKDGFLGLGPGHAVLPTNVTHISRAVSPEGPDGNPQIVYYQAGIGTGWSMFEQLWGGSTGQGLGENIREAYAFLVNNYVDGDRIVLVGFSRGAFTARSLGGLIGDFGLLDKRHKGMQYFYSFFKDWENAGEKDYTPRMSQDVPGFDLGTDEKGRPVTSEDIPSYVSAYRSALGHLTKSVDIEAIGVFDTVGALGIPIHPLIWKAFRFMPRFFRSEYRFYDTSLGRNVKNAFHALALDEHRAAFAPAVWEKPGDSQTNLEQVWFSGVHSNVGGGYNDTGVGDLSLAWMMEKLRPFVNFDDAYLTNEYLANREFYKKQPLKDGETSISLAGQAWRWGLGLVYNSNSFPTRLAGSFDRTPFLYQKSLYLTGQPTGVLLTNTNEKIHPSVRARYQFGGKDCNGDQYKSHALRDWKPEGRKWVYGGTDPNGYGPSLLPKTIEESTLSGYELDLLAYDNVMQENLLGS